MNIPAALADRISRFDLDDRGLCFITIADPEHGLWKIIRLSEVLNKDGGWEYEPLPSSRSEEFIARTRHTLEECVALAQSKGLLSTS